jgi:hypothetical protein
MAKIITICEQSGIEAMSLSFENGEISFGENYITVKFSKENWEEFKAMLSKTLEEMWSKPNA